VIRLWIAGSEGMTAIEALQKSIEHHERLLARQPGESLGPLSCPLCIMFYDDDCEDCPVQIKTGQEGCYGTPYRKLVDHSMSCTENDGGGLAPKCETCTRLEEEEIKFLKKLLREAKQKEKKA
jgi:hypothetical protein